MPKPIPYCPIKLYPRCKVELNEPIDIMKPIAHKKFYLLLNNNFYWSEAFQSLTKSAQNLLFCMIAELRFTGKRGNKKIRLPTLTMVKYLFPKLNFLNKA